MANRTRMVTSAARAMYHSQVPPLLTEDEAWRDADEDTRQEYIVMANVAYASFAATVYELGVVSRGSCCCIEVLRRRPTIPSDRGHSICAVCGGEA